MRERRVEEEDEEATEDEEEEGGEVLASLDNLTIETEGRRRRRQRALRPLWRHRRWRLKGMGGATERKGVEGLNGHWKSLSYSVRMRSRVARRLLMPTIASMS